MAMNGFRRFDVAFVGKIEKEAKRKAGCRCQLIDGHVVFGVGLD